MNRPFRLFVPAVLFAALGTFGWLGFAATSSAPAKEQPHVPPIEIALRWEYKLLAYHRVL